MSKDLRSATPLCALGGISQTNFIWDKVPELHSFLMRKCLYLEENSVKPPFVWKVQISFTKGVLTIFQLLQNQKSYKKEKSVISNFQSLRRETYLICWQNVEFTPCWHFLCSQLFCSACCCRNIFFWENKENSTQKSIWLWLHFVRSQLFWVYSYG